MRRVRNRPSAWSTQDDTILSETYPREGLPGVADLLPHRSHHAIQQRAHKLGLRSPTIGKAPQPVLSGAALEEAIRLHDAGWALATIARQLGYAESATTNAVLIAQCPRKGYRPADRDAAGRLTPESFERLRYMLKKGLKQVEIQLRLGVSASTVSRERKRYDADLAARDKATLPPPGGGQAYSGVKLPAAAKREVEAVLLDGFGSTETARRTGVSHASVKRLRARLVKRLARKGQALPGCNREGRRVTAAKVSRHYIPDSTIEDLRRRLLAGEPVAHIAKALGIGSCGAYRQRDLFAAELAQEGRVLPKPIRLGRSDAGRVRALEGRWLPAGRLSEFRALAHEHGHDEGKRLFLARIEDERRAVAEACRAERDRPKSFEEQLARVARGEAQVVAKINLRRPDPGMTLGGIATGAL